MLLVLSLHKRLCISFVRIAHARNMHSWIAIEVKLWEGWPAVAVGYDLEGTIRFRTCPRFPARGDWFSDALNLCPGVSESARPSGDFDDRNKTTSQMEVDCRRAHGDTILSGLVLVSRQKPKGPPSYRLAIGESLIGLPSLAAASESDKGLENARVNQP